MLLKNKVWLVSYDLTTHFCSISTIMLYYVLTVQKTMCTQIAIKKITHKLTGLFKNTNPLN